MGPKKILGWNRKQVLKLFGVGLVGAVALPAKIMAQVREMRRPTPAQTEGPFYPTSFHSDIDADLTLIAGNSSTAQGDVIEVYGQIVDVEGIAQSGATVEMWQCDTHGTYHHSRDRGRKDDAFQGFGRTVTNEEGFYSFKTIKPVAYPGRPPHIHFKVKANGKRTLTTQMYFKDEAQQNRRDGIYRSLGERSQLVTVDFLPAENSVSRGQFDLVVDS